MSVGSCIILFMTNELVSSVYTFICDPDECDSLIQLTSSDGFGFPSGVTELTCPCGRKTTLVSVEHATITSLNQTKEGSNMDGMTVENLPLSDAEKYNPDQLVTYKVIRGYSDAEYATDKVRNIEYELHNGRTNSKAVSSLQNKIGLVKDIISEAYADSEDQETLQAIAEALEIELVKEIEWSASIEVSGTISVNLLEDTHFDLDSEIEDALYADSHNGNIEVNDQEICNIRENC
jgi:hypothetical protein